MRTVNSPTVYSMHWNNISPTVRIGQAQVFSFLGIPLVQENADQVSHGTWMNEVIHRHASEDVILFCDIDAFPLHRQAYLQAVQAAEEGQVFGLAQFSSHKASQMIYAGPMFMAFRKSTWEALGCPSLERSKQHDAGELLTVRARDKNIPLLLPMPTACLIPKWALAHQGVFGIGSFYGVCDFFHLFESRHPAYETILDAVVADVVSATPLNFQLYLELVEKMNAYAKTPRKRNWVPKPLRRFFS